MTFLHLTGPWFWIALGLLLLGLELLGAGGFLLATGVAALIVAAITFYAVLSWPVQLLLFGICTIVSTFIYWKYLKPNNTHSEDPLLNNRMARLVGERTELISDVSAGSAKVQIHDALWTVRCDEMLSKGTTVEITGYQGSTLTVKAI